jgi:polar amino acid transport system substrate-binding protein
VLAISLFVGIAGAAQAAESQPLRVGVTPRFPPLIFKEAGKIVGVEADFAQALGQALGRPVQFVEVDWEDQVDQLLDGRTDIIMSAMSVTRPRQFRVNFSEAYARVGQMMLVRREDAHKYALGLPYNQQANMGVMKATTGDFLVQQEFPKAKRKTYASGEAAVQALTRKNIEIFISDSPLILYLAAQNESRGLQSVPVLLSDEMLAWGMRKSDPALLETVNRFLIKAKQDGSCDRILRRWVPGLK